MVIKTLIVSNHHRCEQIFFKEKKKSQKSDYLESSSKVWRKNKSRNSDLCTPLRDFIGNNEHMQIQTTNKFRLEI